MAHVQIIPAGSKRRFAVMPIVIHFKEGSTAPKAFRNELLTKVSGAQTDSATKEYLVLWNAEDESYSSVLTDIIGQIARTGAKRIEIRHGAGTSFMVCYKDRKGLENFRLSLAKKLVTRFEHMTIRLSFSWGDETFPKLLRESIQQVKSIVAEA